MRNGVTGKQLVIVFVIRATRLESGPPDFDVLPLFGEGYHSKLCNGVRLFVTFGHG